jgi:predicted nucleotidyltransferase component of viral defense system
MLDEILATKLRALYQRRKGRDLFSLWLGVGMKAVDPRKVVHAFRRYLEAEGSSVTRGDFQRNLAAKVESRPFNEDLRPLLAPGVHYEAPKAAEIVSGKLLSLL